MIPKTRLPGFPPSGVPLASSYLLNSVWDKFDPLVTTPEQTARIQIDAQLGAAGWTIQDIATLNLSASRGVAVREMQSFGGPADYILFVDGKALGIIEAKKVGTTLSVSTIQRLYSQLSGNATFDDEADEHSGYEAAGATAGKDPLEVRYNPKIGYGACVEQITYLLFLKLAEEMSDLGYDNPIPAKFGWSVLSSMSGDALEWSGATWTSRQGRPEGWRGGANQIHYRHTLENLGKVPGLVGIIFRKAQNKISNPSDLQRVIKMIGDEDWSGMDVDIKGAIYEGCEPHGHFLEKAASSSDKGAGQYFTPRPLIRAIVDVMAPKPGQVIGDPACGTGGFLLAAHDFISQHNKLDKAARKHLKTEALWGTDIVPGVVSLCAMNMYLHGIGKVAEASSRSSGKGSRQDAAATVALAQPSGRKFDMILANPLANKDLEDFKVCYGCSVGVSPSLESGAKNAKASKNEPATVTDHVEALKGRRRPS